MCAIMFIILLIDWPLSFNNEVLNYEPNRFHVYTVSGLNVDDIDRVVYIIRLIDISEEFINNGGSPETALLKLEAQLKGSFGNKPIYVFRNHKPQPP